MKSKDQKNNWYRSRNKGLIGIIALIILALIVLGYFGFNVRNIIQSPQVQDNLSYFWGGVKTLWSELANIATSLYNSLVDFINTLVTAVSGQ